jgi:F0F1-type ATP synthase assembly protein I
VCVIVALTTARARISALEAKLKASLEAWESANATKVSAEKATKSAKTRAKKAKKALAGANQKQAKREQSVAERLDKISVLLAVSVVSLLFGYLLRLSFADMCLLILFASL